MSASFDQLEQAIHVAVAAHHGQRDKSGNPYVLHVLRVMLAVQDPLAQQAAALHDVVEDTAVSLNNLRESGFEPRVLEAVDLLTHRPGVSYADYVIAIKPNELARQVKIADLADNYSLSRVAFRETNMSEDSRRIGRYILSHQYLRNELDEPTYRRRMLALED